MTSKHIIYACIITLGFSSWVSSKETIDTKTAVKPIELKKIMSDPKWISNSPQNASWLAGSNEIVFQQNKEVGELKDTFKLNINNLETEQVKLTNLYQVKQDDLVFSPNSELAAYVYENDIYLLHMTGENKLVQLTKTSARESSPQFIGDRVLSYWAGNTIFAIDLNTNLTSELIKLQMSEAPKEPSVPDDIIAKEQHELIDYVVNQHKNSLEKFNHKKLVKQNDNRVTNSSVYLGSGQRFVQGSLSPKGDRMLVVTSKSVPWRAESDLMPNYIAHNGRIQFDQVRPRVADAKPNQQNYWLIDVKSKQVDKLSIDVLPDFDKDVLKSVRIENFREKGEKYKSKREPRTINLMSDWTWSQSPIQWHNNGEQVAVMLEAWDNKDRWIATVDLEDKKFVTQHQLHDDAWINYTFNDFGWFNHSETLYFQSEQSGYSHIYTKALSSNKIKQITAGKYETSKVKLTKNDKTFYFRANVNHPGDYQIYRVSAYDKKVKNPIAITQLKGDNNYSLSPDETKLLITHSNLLTPEELYLTNADGSTDMVRLTNTVSDEFNNMPWTKPEIIEVDSSYTDQPVYAKVYYPADYKAGEKRKAVIFNHGAGYLQNSHYGWSGYFREFMFHSMLAQQGYVVMDMDYRASKGYGRDWRTAIYRQMGTPEIQDLKDGVNWLVENANVDRERIGTYGGSYGGFMTFMAMFNEPELFKAGAALRPVSDWAHYNDGYTSNILNRPEDDMIAYRKSSPIYFAEGLKNPLLINAPMVDNNVFFVDVVRLVQRMIELELENFETAIYPVEPHGFKQPSSWLDEYRRIYKLFETNL
jgi:dipeptidyl aminopeptidase/acylaminoacyl peptidase